MMHPAAGPLDARANAGNPSASLLAVFALYGGAFLIGATFSLFAASSAYLRDLRGFSDTGYGSIYLPQLATATFGAVVGAFASRSGALRRLYRIALVCFLLAQLLLALTGVLPYGVSTTTALLTAMGATAAWGFGFGLGGGPINGLVTRQFYRKTSAAITAWYMCGGVGLTVSPFLVRVCEGIGHWVYSPLLLAVLTALVAWASFVLPERASRDTVTAARVQWLGHASGELSFWCLALAALCYGLTEATFSNWAVLYCRDDLRLSQTEAAAALSAFWGCLTLGRLASSLLALRLEPSLFLKGLPLLTIAAFLIIRTVNEPVTAIAAFGFAGVACSSFFPMLVANAAQRYSDEVAWVAAVLTACVMTGDGIGSYVIGALRAAVGTRDLYLYAVAYPILAVVCVVTADRHSLRAQSLGRGEDDCSGLRGV